MDKMPEEKDRVKDSQEDEPKQQERVDFKWLNLKSRRI